MSDNTETTSPNIAEQVNSIITNDALNTPPFSEAAQIELQTKVGDYIKDLISESIRVSKQYNADSISQEDIKRAAAVIVNRPGDKLHKHLGTIGGLLLGTGLSTFATMISENSFTLLGVIFTVITSIPGAFLIAFHMAKE